MKRVAEGSVILIVFVILTLITLWATNLWRTTVYMNDVVLAKQKYEQQFRLAEGLLEYGIQAAQLLYSRWQHEATQSASCLFDQWPPHESRSGQSEIDSYAGKITILKKDKNMTIHAQLLEKNKVVVGIGCIVQEVSQEPISSADEGKHSVFTVSQWGLDER